MEKIIEKRNGISDKLPDILTETEAQYEKLDFTNDFIFCKVLENNETICKELLELILERKVRKIVYQQKQKEIKITSQGKGIRLDVYLEDEVNTVYDIEMQASTKYDLPKRSRYYQGMIDLNLIQKGAPYTNLKRSYVIFICLKNPFDGIRHKYTFENICKENTAIKLQDDAWKVFLTPDGMLDDVSEKMKEFLKYLTSQKPEGTLTKNIHAEVVRARNHEEWRLEYMTLYMRDQENILIGSQKKTISLISKKLIKGQTLEQIADALEESVENISKIYEVARKFAPDYNVEEIYKALQESER